MVSTSQSLSLRRLDVSIEIARRQEDTQISLKTAQDAVTFCAEWMRISVKQFLSSEALAFMGIKTLGESKALLSQKLL